MGFFDEIGKKIVDGGQGVVQKTKDTAEVLKLNGMISDQEKAIKACYTSIGELYFNNYSDSFDPIFADYINAVKESKEKIEDYAEKVRKLKGTIACPNCSAELPYGAQFCNNCGFKIAMQNEKVVLSDVLRCTKCGAALKEGSAFCTTCGSKVEAAPVEPEVTEASKEEAANVAEPVAEEPTQKKCPQCDTVLSEDTAFCIECGFKL